MKFTNVWEFGPAHGLFKSAGVCGFGGGPMRFPNFQPVGNLAPSALASNPTPRSDLKTTPVSDLDATARSHESGTRLPICPASTPGYSYAVSLELGPPEVDPSPALSSLFPSLVCFMYSVNSSHLSESFLIRS